MFWLDLKKDSDTPLFRQVYHQLRQKILTGELPQGHKLPSTRELAANLSVSRNVILEAYDQLTAEGYLESSAGSGTYVARGAFFEGYNECKDLAHIDPPISKTNHNAIIDFRSGLPALNHFPRKRWGQLYQNICLDTPLLSLGYGSPEGCIELRTTLSKYLLKTRGVRCTPEQIIITTGAVQALSLATNLLLSHGGKAILEDPSNYDLQKILGSRGASILPVPVDDYGLITNLLPMDKAVKLVYITPSHQFPLGGILPIQRRIELVRYAQDMGCWILEDDYDSEFRYEGPPVSSIQELAPHQVIYIGTFSKILSPALRIGYMILPEALITKCRQLKRHADYQTPTLEQLTLSKFIESGCLERHIAKMKKLYYRRRQTFISCFENNFPGQHKIIGKAAGLHLVVEFLTPVQKSHLLELRKLGVRLYPVAVHSAFKEENRSKFIFGYGNLTDEQIEKGIEIIKEVLSRQSRNK